MARGKAGKDGEKKHDKHEKASKKIEEPPPPAQEENEIQPLPSSAPKKSEGESPELVDSQPILPEPEPVYDEPVLTQLIVLRYEGENVKGLYDGEAEADFDGGHKYKGMFSEGMMHGFGIYTWSDGVTYEGEFFKNSILGKGTYTWADGSKYIGDLVNGIRDGCGLFTTADGQRTYSGQWSQGKRHAKGKMTYNAESTSYYEGDWVENVMHGWGKRQYASGNVYEGMWFKNIRHGEGLMKWLNPDGSVAQMYVGHWDRGIQQGNGQHSWFLKRVPGSQYPLRNMYDGEFVNGERQGYGVFYYANGAQYHGEWRANKKNGKGKFIFKNGRVYEGVFHEDHITEFPNFEISCVTTPDMSRIRTRTPLPAESISFHSNTSQNTYTPSFQLDIDYVLQLLDEASRDNEGQQVYFAIMRHTSSLRRVYNFYSRLGNVLEDAGESEGFTSDRNPDNTYMMTRMQFWRFLKDCKIHHLDTTLVEVDRLLVSYRNVSFEIHSPYGSILFREFVNHLVLLSHHVFHNDHKPDNGPMLAWCFSKLVSEKILPYACTLQGYIYPDIKKALHIFEYMGQAYETFGHLCVPSKRYPNEPVMGMRHLLLILKEMKLLNKKFTAKVAIDVLAFDDPKVTYGGDAVNLEWEMTFLEFLEALVGFAQVYIAESAPRKLTIPRDRSAVSFRDPGTRSPSSSFPLRDGGVISQVIYDDEVANICATPKSISDSMVKTNEISPPKIESAGHLESPPPPVIVEPVRVKGDHTRAESRNKKSEKFSQKKMLASTSAVSQVAMASPVPLRPTPISTPQILVKSTVSVVPSEVSSMHDQKHDEAVSVVFEQSEGLLDVCGLEEAESEMIDEQTRIFNHWLEKVDFFLMDKFFPAAQRYIQVSRLVEERHKQQTLRDSISDIQLPLTTAEF